MDFFVYETYQDVRKNLIIYSIPVFILSGFFCYFRILPENHKIAIYSFLQTLIKDPVLSGWFGVGVGSVIFGSLAFLLFEIFQIHDHLYDRFLIRWRHYYATDFILPRLIQPFANLVNYRFNEEAEIHTGPFQEVLYYPFVGDRDLKIPKNKLIRFYEAVTPYWLTQVNEIILIMLSAVIGVYTIIGSNDAKFLQRLLVNWIILAALFLLNRLCVRKSLSIVRRATIEEIRAIHENPDLINQLEEHLKKLSKDYKFPFK